MPVDKRLQALRPAEAGAESRQMLIRWSTLHAVRSVLDTLAMPVVAWASISPR